MTWEEVNKDLDAYQAALTAQTSSGVDRRVAALGPLLGAQQIRHEALELGELALHGLQVPRHEGRVAVNGG